MPSLAKHNELASLKTLLIGASGTGKTGALYSLMEAGYKLNILDFDNGLDILVERAHFHDRLDLLDNVNYMTIQEPLKISPIDGKAVAKAAKPKAFSKAMLALDHWKDGDIDLGRPSDWGQDTVLVIDSLTFLSKAAFYHSRFINTNPNEMSTYGLAQGMLEACLSLLTADSMRCHVIVCAHITYIDMDGGAKKGFPTTIGKAFSPQVPSFFNTMLEVRTSGTGDKVTRNIHTVPTNLLDIKCPLDISKIPAKMPIESGLATFFKAMRS